MAMEDFGRLRREPEMFAAGGKGCGALRDV